MNGAKTLPLALTAARLAAALAALLAMPERDGTQSTARTRRDIKREARAALAAAELVAR